MNKIYYERKPLPMNIGGEILYFNEVQYPKESIEKMIKEQIQKQKEYQKIKTEK